MELDNKFLNHYKEVSPDFGPLGYITYKRTYSRIKDDGTGEEFWETIKRVVEGTYTVQERYCKLNRLPWSASKAQRSAQEMYRRMFEMKFLPPGRGLWAMGTSVVDKVGSAALFNCGFVSTKNIDQDFAEPFCWLMDMLMLGAGIGFDVKGAGKVELQYPERGGTYYVEDTREGWVGLVREILNSFVSKSYFPDKIDYSGIRPAGVPLKTFGGVASGYKPLADLVDNIWDLAQEYIGKPISSSFIVDMMNVIGKCVVAGNVRRSSEIALSDPTEEFLNLKNPDVNKDKLYSHRWASNNSIFAKIGMDYKKYAELTAKNGEPGYVWMENTQQFGRLGDTTRPDTLAAGWNPCSEQSLEDHEMCCLVETFPSRHEDYKDFERTLKFAYLYGKTVTLIPTHNRETNAVIMKNRRIGTSQSGIVQNFQKIGRRQHLRWCDKGYEYLRKLDKQYSNWLCTPLSIKVTTVKPSGTVSLLPGVTPGVHYPHSQFYLRAIRFQENSDLLPILEEAGYRIEVDKYSPNTKVVFFPVEEKYFDRSKEQVSMWEQLENVAQIQQYWSDNGVSATITFSKNEAKDIAYALELYETRLKTISFLPLSDHGYEQAPYQEITEEEYKKYASELRPLLWQQSSNEMQDRGCDGEACTINWSK